MIESIKSSLFQQRATSLFLELISYIPIILGGELRNFTNIKLKSNLIGSFPDRQVLAVEAPISKKLLGKKTW